MHRIYLDYNASTPIDPRVAAAMRPFLEEGYGNPSSGHWAGAPAHLAVERARGQIAGLLGCSAEEIVFTSGGTEANNWALKGVAHALRSKGDHIVTSTVEHPAVDEPCNFLAGLGYRITRVPVDRTGWVDPDDVRRALTAKTILVSIMHANNEVGTVQPIQEIGRIAREQGVLLHTDAAQSLGKIEAKVEALGVDLLSLAGHKLYGPKGVGALYVRRETPLEPLLHGGGHESGRRSSTESALLAVGLGLACELAGDLETMESVRELREVLWQGLKARFGDGVVLNGHEEERLPNTLNVSFVGRVGAEILGQLDGVAASTGSACHSDRIELSPVLRAMDVPPRIGMGAIRFSLGRGTSRDEIEAVLARLQSLPDAAA